MPVPTNLEQQFSSLSTADDHNNNVGSVVKNVNTNVAGATAAVLVTPTKEDLSQDQHSFSSDDEEEPSSPVGTMLVRQKTEHKLKEERGELQPEPLLQENPHRFVIFPIQDNDVSLFSP
jgi:hypothetical protein